MVVLVDMDKVIFGVDEEEEVEVGLDEDDWVLKCDLVVFNFMLIDELFVK